MELNTDSAYEAVKELLAKNEAQDMIIAELRQLLYKAKCDADRYFRRLNKLTEENERLKVAILGDCANGKED